MTATVATVLPGRSLTSEEGSVGFCGTYLVTAPGRRILFDPGHAGRRAALLRRLAELGAAPEDIDAVVLSHAHWDHAQNADLFPRARVLAHRAELERTAHDRPDDPVTPAWTGAMLRYVGAEPVADGDRIAPEVRVVHLPGHTAGSIGLRVGTAAGRAVLAGDAVSRRDVAASRSPAIIHFDAAAARASIDLVLAEADEVWPGHDAPFRVVDGRPAERLHPPAALRLRDHALSMSTGGNPAADGGS